MKNLWTSSQLMTNKSYTIAHYCNKDLQEVSLHSHDFYELYFFISGNASYIIDNFHYRLEPGDILLISPSNLHRLKINDTSVEYERMVLWINPRYLSKLSTTNTKLSFCFEECSKSKNFLIRDKHLSEEIKFSLFALYNKGNDFGSDIFAELQIKSILLKLCVFFKQEGKVNQHHVQKINPIIKKVIDYIDSNLGKRLTLDSLAEYVYVSKYYLSRLFKNETSSTLHQYILKKRLVYAKQLIEQSYPIIELYTKCGFSDYSHFFRAFKDEFGMAPRKYLQLIKRI